LELLDSAIKFAVDAHSGMTRKRSNTPYIVHPMEAAVIVSTMTSNDEVIAAAVLHDVVEDTPATIDDVRRRFGDRVAKLVASETEDKRSDRPASETWRERKEESLSFLASTDDLDVKRVWLGDKLSNMRSYYRLYLKEGPNLWRNFHQTDPLQQEWYYRRIADLLSDLSDTEAWQEYSFLVDLVFEGNA
jgi:myo-inositol-1(or 4)-monophosphatase